MIVPIRCFSCGKPIGHLWEKYLKLLEDGKSIEEALNEIGLKRYCCRATFMGTVENYKLIAKYVITPKKKEKKT